MSANMMDLKTGRIRWTTGNGAMQAFGSILGIQTISVTLHISSWYIVFMTATLLLSGYLVARFDLPHLCLPCCVASNTRNAGELLFWWSIFIGCSSTFTGALTVGYYTIVGPIFVTALLFGLSGLPLLESGSNKLVLCIAHRILLWQTTFLCNLIFLIFIFPLHRRFGSNPEYLLYRQKTSILIPLPHFVYENTPGMLKGDYSFSSWIALWHLFLSWSLHTLRCISEIER